MKENYNRYFICPLLPKEQLQQLNGSVAANNFCNNLISSNIFTDIIPYWPTGNIDPTKLRYNNNKVRVICNKKWRNCSILCKFSFIYENIQIFSQVKRNSTVWFYNLPYTIILLFILIKIFKPSVKCNIIILDFTPGRKGIKGFLDSIEINCINRMHGMIKLADSSLFTVCNSVCLPGIVSMDGLQYPRIITIKKEFLISGTLEDNIAMLPLLLDVFSQLPDFILHIAGRAKGSDINFIKKYTSKHNNIIYHGMVSYDEYLHILHNTPFLLNTRNPQSPENQCNFPSKIIESLLHNRIIVSTLHYKQLQGIRYFKVRSINSEIFIRDLKKIVTMSSSDLLTYANQADEVRKRFNSNIWKQAIQNIEMN